MLIGDEGRRSNLRVMYGILASNALAKLNSVHEGERRPSGQDVYFLNLIRLLEMYRYGTFYSPPPNGVLESKPLISDRLSQRSAVPESEMVLNAIQSAHSSVSDLPRDQFVECLEVIFNALHESSADLLDKESVKKARDFLSCFVAELRKGVDNA